METPEKTGNAVGELRLWTNDFYTFVARDPAHVLELYEATIGEPYDPEAGEWEERANNGPLTINFEEEGGGRITKTHAEWIAENGPGLLCQEMV